MLNKNIPREKLDSLKLLVLDSDGVSIPRGTEIEEIVTSQFLELKIKTFVITEKFAENIKTLRKRLMVAVSSGRSLLYLETMYGKILGSRAALQAENGSISLIGGRVIQHEEYDEEYFSLIARIRERAQRFSIKGVEPKQFILTIHAEREIMEIYDILKEEDKEGILKVMWNGEAFDIQKKEISKASGLRHLMKYWGVEREEVMAIGDRINDKELLEAAGVGVSADKDALPALYWVSGDRLAGEVLVEYLINEYNLI